MTSIPELARYVQVYPDPRSAAWSASFRRAIVSLGAVLPRPRITGVQRDQDGDIVAFWLDVPSWSKPGRFHCVTFFPRSGGAVCRCDAGVQGQPCWHAAAAWIWLNRDSRLPDPIRLRIDLGQFTDAERIERERARIEAALAGAIA